MSKATIKHTLTLYVGSVYWFAPGCSAIANIAASPPTTANERSISLRYLWLSFIFLKGISIEAWRQTGLTCFHFSTLTLPLFRTNLATPVRIRSYLDPPLYMCLYFSHPSWWRIAPISLWISYTIYWLTVLTYLLHLITFPTMAKRFIVRGVDFPGNDFVNQFCFCIIKSVQRLK